MKNFKQIKERKSKKCIVCDKPFYSETARENINWNKQKCCCEKCYMANYYKNNKKHMLKLQVERLEMIRKDKNHPLHKKYDVRHRLTPHRNLKKYCEICGSKKDLERHHWRYDKPKMIAILCKECHKIQHEKRHKD